MKVVEHYGSGGVYALSPDFLASFECEVESVKTGAKSPIPAFKAVADGSLRNGGVEFCSVIAQPRAKAIESFKHLYANISLGEEPFSERTSTHVHVNVSNMDMAHARQMVLLYALFEEFFFAMVKPNRRDNIHCVPLTETYLPGKYHLNMAELVKHWHKYTALNLKRMPDLGSMEFRHMHGTKDPVEMDLWINVLENLFKLSQRVEVNAETLSNKDTIREWFEAIFFPADNVMKLRPSLFDIIKNSLIDVKMSTVEA
jgi:hypothetical protein